MRKIKNIIFIITLICISIFTTNVNAEVIDINSCHFTISGPAYPVKNYPLYTQKLVCGNRSFDFYCIDAGISNPKNAKNMNISYLQSSGLDSILAQGNGLSYFQKQVALRKWAHKVGLNTYYTTAMKNVVENKFSGQDFQIGWARGNAAATDLRTIQVSGDTVFTLLVTNVTRDESGNFTATISVSPLDSSINLARVSWSSKTSGVSVSKSADGKTLTVSGTMQECKGKKVKLRADVSNARTDGNPGNGGNNGNPGDGGTNGTPYVYLVPQSGRVQAGIVHVIGSGIRFTDGTPGNEGNDGDDGDDGDNGNDGSNDVYTFTINIPDPNCDCGADYTGAFKCDGSGRSTEYLRETSNILSCIISGNYNDYCGSSIEKTTDNNGSSLKTPTLSDKVSGYSIALADNNYCSVYCKEDIDYSLPGKIQANNGRYFTLQQGALDSETGKPIVLKGTRSCYTDEINIDLFKEHVKEKQKEIISNYNDWLKYKAYSESAASADSQDHTCQQQSCSNGSLTNGSSTTYKSYEGDAKTYTPYKVNGSINSNGTSSLSSDSVQTVTATWTDSISGSATQESCGNTGYYYSSCPTLTDTITPQEKAEEYNNKAVAALRRAKAAETQLEQILKQYKSCYEWNNNYCFEPEITFSYEDGEIYKDINNQKLEGSITKYDDSAVYGYVDVDSDREYNANGTILSLEGKNYIYLNGESLEQQNVKVNLTYKFVKKVSKATKTFDKSTVKVCTYHPVGTIVTGDSCYDGKNKVTLGDDGYVFPITLQKKESRQYNYNLTFTNIGVAGDDSNAVRGNAGSCKGGRLMGCQNGTDVYSSTTKRTEAKYVCQYSNCPECNVVCECPADNPSCYVDEEGECHFVKDCPTCKVECEGCLWNDGDVAFGYKQISLSDMFPNSNTNEVGYNWNTGDTNPEHNKASATIEAIEDKKEKAYTTPEYSYTLNPATMASIRSYNKEANKDSVSSVKWGDDISIPIGGYNNDTLTCTNGEKCISSFLNGLDDMADVTNKRSTKWKVFNKTTNKWEVK